MIHSVVVFQVMALALLLVLQREPSLYLQMTTPSSNMQPLE